MPRTTLFIYGTLKRGHCRAPLLAGQRYLRTAQTTPHYRLLNCGTYPGLMRVDGEGTSVVGELWEVEGACLAKLDREEGVDVGLYQRTAIDIEGSPGNAEGFLYLQETDLLENCGQSWTLELERNALGQDG